MNLMYKNNDMKYDIKLPKYKLYEFYENKRR